MSSDQVVHNFDSVKGHMAGGALWMVGMRWTLRLVGLVNILIIARLLTPDDFGVTTMACIVVEFLIMLTETDVDVGLLRDNHCTRDYMDTAWTIKIVLGLMTFVVLVALSPVAAFYYHDDRVQLVIEIVSIRAIFMGFENIGVVEFRRSLDFSKEFRYSVWRRLIMFVVALGLVLILHNYMALALAAPISEIVTVIVSFTMSQYRPRLCLLRWRELWRFSRWQMLYNSARFINGRVDQFAVGGLTSAGTIGAYYVASDIATMPTRELIWPMGRAFTPALAKIIHSREEMRLAWKSTLGFIAIITVAAGVGMSVIAEEAVRTLLGTQWDQAVGFFRWLALYGLFEGFVLSMEAFFIAHKRERVLALVTFGQLTILVPLLFATGHYLGIGMIAEVRTAVMALTTLVMFSIMVRSGWIGVGDILSTLWRPVIAALVMAAAVMAVHQPGLMVPLLSLILQISVGAVVFTATLYLLWRLSGCPDGAENALLARLGGWQTAPKKDFLDQR